MFVSIRHYLILLLCQALVVSTALGQDRASELERSLTELERVYGEELAGASMHIRQELDRLSMIPATIASLRGGYYAALTEDYVRGLQDHIKLLRDSRSLPPSGQLAVLEEVAKDLEIKQRFFDYHETDYRDVRVKVRTLDGNRVERDGFTVHFIASGYHMIYTYQQVELSEITRKLETKTLMNPSSPTSIAIPPGVYVWWTERDGKFGETRRYEIGDDPGGRRREPILISLPVLWGP